MNNLNSKTRNLKAKLNSVKNSTILKEISSKNWNQNYRQFYKQTNN